MDRYFEDYKVGEVWRSRGYTFTESAIIDFALIYDPQPFHIDVGAAEKGPYTGLIASGFQTLAISFRLLWQERQFTASSMGSPGFEQLRWLKPVRPGDTIRAEAEILEIRPSSRADRGYVTLICKTLNQKNETVMDYRCTIIMRTRASPAAETATLTC
mgnify:FL=1